MKEKRTFLKIFCSIQSFLELQSSDDIVYFFDQCFFVLNIFDEIDRGLGHGKNVRDHSYHFFLKNCSN